jgi:hypothetical protein
MSPEKKWVKSWSRGKKKTQAPLKNKATWVLCNHSNSMVATGFSLMSRRRRLTPYTVMMDGTFDYYDNEGISCRLPF